MNVLRFAPGLFWVAVVVYGVRVILTALATTPNFPVAFGQ